MMTSPLTIGPSFVAGQDNFLLDYMNSNSADSEIYRDFGIFLNKRLDPRPNKDKRLELLKYHSQIWVIQGVPEKILLLKKEHFFWDTRFRAKPCLK